MYSERDKQLCSQILFYTMGMPLIGMISVAICWNACTCYQKENAPTPTIEKITHKPSQKQNTSQKYRD